MPSIRSGFGSDFVLKSEKIGIGSTTPTSVFDVAGAIKGDFAVTGVATLTSYGGFVAQNQHINKASSIGFATVGLQTAGAATGFGATHVANQYYEIETGFTDLGGVHHGDDQYFNTLSEDLIVEDGQILNITNTEMVGLTTIGEYDPHTHSSYVCAGSLEQVSVTDHFSFPNGGINDRQETPIEGTVRFNTDLNTLEFFNGNEWRQFTYNQGQSGRAVFGGGYSVSGTNNGNMEFINIMSLGNGVNFGDMVLSAKYSQSGCSDGKRGLFVGGQNVSDIEYITIASAGDSIDFGNLTGSNGNHCGSLSSSTRGIRGGGYTSPAGIDVIDYVEIQTLGNAIDFGNLLEGNYGLCGFSSPTRGIFAGGRGADAPLGQTTINVITISSKGDATRFGDMSARHSYVAGFSNSVRGFITGGGAPTTDTIQYVTIASEGNAQDFGNLSVAKEGSCSGNSANQVRGICAGGVESAPAGTKIIEYVTIASQGNSQDFGDMSSQRGYAGALSDSHGGLGGF